MGRYNFNQKTQDGYEISPEQAKKWLEKNDNNRNINYAKVKKMAKDMKEGHWDTTHQGIAIPPMAHWSMVSIDCSLSWSPA